MNKVNLLSSYILDIDSCVKYCQSFTNWHFIIYNYKDGYQLGSILIT